MTKNKNNHSYKSIMNEAKKYYAGFNEIISLKEFIELQLAVEKYAAEEINRTDAMIKVNIALELLLIHTVRKN